MLSNSPLIVVACDLSDYSWRTLEFAATMTDAISIKAICVLAIPNAAEPGIIWATTSRDVATRRCQEQFLEGARAIGLEEVQLQVAFGDPATEIVRYACDCGSDLILVSSHGRSGVTRLLIGSVAEKIIRHSDRPVLLLPAKWLEKRVAEISM